MKRSVVKHGLANSSDVYVRYCKDETERYVFGGIQTVAHYDLICPHESTRAYLLEY